MHDLRIPTGLLFAVLGLILLGYGIIQPDLRAPLSDVNVNLYSGAALFLFGGTLLWLSRRAN